MANRLDGWQNLLTGLGNSLTDRASATTFQPGRVLDDQTIDDLYNFDPLCSIVCNAYPEEALRRGIKIAGPEAERVQAETKRLGLRQAVEDAAGFARAFGGSIIYLDTGTDPAVPLQGAANIRELRVYDKRRVLRSVYTDRFTFDVRRAELFDVQPLFNESRFTVHRSRILLFGGAKTTDTARATYSNGWDLSVLDRVIESIRAFNNGYLSAGNMLTDASVGVFKMHGLISALTKNSDAVAKRASLLDLGRSVARSLFVDPEWGEDYRVESRQFSGIPDMIDRLANLVSTTTGIPVTILTGQAPAGLNATGESDIRIWRSRVGTYRTNELEPQIQRALDVGWPGHRIEWPSFEEPTERESAELGKIKADTKAVQAGVDAIYLDRECLTPQAVVEARFGPNGWTDEIRENPADFAAPDFSQIPEGVVPPATEGAAGPSPTPENP